MKRVITNTYDYEKKIETVETLYDDGSRIFVTNNYDGQESVATVTDTQMHTVEDRAALMTDMIGMEEYVAWVLQKQVEFNNRVMEEFEQ